MKTASGEFTIVNQLGLHARSAAKIVETAGKFQADIRICRGEVCADAKSILDILTLACPKGTAVRVEATGTDADSAVREIGELIRNGFDEGSES